MNNIGDEDLEALLNDPLFHKWVTDPDEASETYWQNQMDAIPGLDQKLAAARHILLSLHADCLELTPEQATTNIDFILRKTQPTTFRRAVFWRAAAACLLLVGATYFFFQERPHSQALSGDLAATSAPNVFANPGKVAELITLADGSTVLLQPHSRLTESFTDTLRKVYLEGDAFFEVAKNPEWPFAVQTRNLTTKVLGTSFRVRDFDDDQAPLVRVSTGKVTVTRSSSAREATLPGKPLETLVLLPRESAVLERNVLTVNHGTTESEPVALLPAESIEHVYKRTPIETVFNSLTDTYGVRILYDRELLANCSLTAKLADEPLAEKLRMICLGLNLTLEQNSGNTYTITGRGCR